MERIKTMRCNNAIRLEKSNYKKTYLCKYISIIFSLRTTKASDTHGLNQETS